MQTAKIRKKKLTNIFDTINEQISREKTSDDLNKWFDLFLKIEKVEIHNTKQLINVLQANLPNIEAFSDYMVALAEIEKIESFIIKAFNIKKTGIQIAFEKKIKEAQNHLISIQRNVQSMEYTGKQLESQQQRCNILENQITETIKMQWKEQSWNAAKNGTRKEFYAKKDGARQKWNTEI